MKLVRLNVRLPQRFAAHIAQEARRRNISKSAVVRERLDRNKEPAHASSLDDIADLIGSAEGLPPDLSARKKYYLKKTGFGRSKAADYTKLGR